MVHAAAMYCFAVFVLFGSGCSGGDARGSGRGSLLASSASSPVGLSSRDSARVGGLDQRAPDSDRPSAEFRRTLPSAALVPAPSPELRIELERMSQLLAEDDVAGARNLAAQSASRFPANTEPLEIVLLCCLRQEDSKGFEEAVGRIARIDPASPFVVAHAGLRAASAGDWAGCLANLSWFVGQDALPRRGRLVPLVSAPGEFEEQAGFAAMKLGRYGAAESLLSAAIAAAGSPRRAELIALLRSDALAALGRWDDARSSVSAATAASDPADPVAGLRSLRLDRIRIETGDAGGALSESIDSLLAEPFDDVALWRTLRAAEAADSSERLRALLRIDPARERLGSFRHALASAALDPSRRTQALDDAWLDVSDLGAPVDRVALGLSLRQIRRHAPGRLVPLACFIAEWRPNDLDSVAYALLGAGAGPDELVTELATRRDAASTALRARVLARFGFPEEALGVVEAARRERPTSKVLRVAAALAAVDLLDATLLGAVDAVARRDDGSTDRTMALAWYALQEMPIARERAAAAVAFDGRDRAARLCLALASLEVPSDRSAAGEAVRLLATARDSTGGEAWTMRSEVASSLPQPDARRVAETWPACTNSVAALRALAAECDASRIPLAAECIGLIEQIDPMQRALVLLGRLGPAQRPVAFDAWISALADEAPALPDRRLLARIGADKVAAELPPSPPSARFDWINHAPRQSVRAYRLSMVATRPDGPEKQSILILDDIEAERVPQAMQRAVALASSGESRLPALAARRSLVALSELANAGVEGQASMRALVQRFVGRMDRMAPADLSQAMRLFVATNPGPREVEAFAGELARRARPMLLSEAKGAIESLGGIARAADDPFAAGALARALALDDRSAEEVRRKLATAAVGLMVGAGADADECTALVNELAAKGACPFEEPETASAGFGEGLTEAGGEVPTARSLQRAAELYALLGQAAESRVLLERALAMAPADAQLLNGVAYSDLERGEVRDGTAVMAERAAAARPDDPAVLDTLGFLRYHQGRFADDRTGTGAISLFRQALRLRPNSPSITTLDHLGDALWRSGDQQGAIRSWQQVGVVARRRYPPELFQRRMSSFQLERFGYELIPLAQFVRREYGTVVGRAERKLEQVAKGEPPDVADCSATR